MFDFTDQSCFYFFQILDRTKKWNNKNRCIKSYFIDNLESLLAKREEMIIIANATGSRIYVHPARRSKAKVDLELLAYVATRLKESNDCNKMWRAYESVCGRNKWVEKRWVVDIDSKWLWIVTSVMWVLKKIKPSLSQDDYFLVPTVKWIHLVTKKWFDLKSFEEEFPNIDVHKNNPTILYAP